MPRETITVYLNVFGDQVRARWRTDLPDGAFAEADLDLLPGDRLGDKTYEDLVRHGSGAIEIAFDDP